ncbi:MAG TPA: hypothetical protein V6C52_07965 [Coleofasciculaceae cyanobacterium]|jgi:hypothetical protein
MQSASGIFSHPAARLPDSGKFGGYPENWILIRDNDIIRTADFK